MNVSVFKASWQRLMVWVVLPPLVIVGLGLSTYALQRRSQWKVNQIRLLSDVSPRLVQAQKGIDDLLGQFESDTGEVVQSEDQLHSFLQEMAQQVGFTVDSVSVDRGVSSIVKTVPMLTAKLKGSGSFSAIQRYLNEVTTAQPLLSERSVQLSKSRAYGGEEVYQADLVFQLLLFDATGDGSIR